MKNPVLIIGLSIALLVAVVSARYDVCEDHHDKCYDWALKGWCYKKWMQRKCPDSCALCYNHEYLPEKCEDEDATECKQYAYEGKCVKKRVQKKCPKSCGKCDTDADYPAPKMKTGDSHCMDTNVKCQKWVKESKCYKTWVQEKCPYSCGYCGAEVPSFGEVDTGADFDDRRHDMTAPNALHMFDEDFDDEIEDSFDDEIAEGFDAKIDEDFDDEIDEEDFLREFLSRFHDE